MAEGMITKGTKPQWFEEDRSLIASAIATILMQARAGSISPQQAAEFFTDMVRQGWPPQTIEKEIARDIDSMGEVFPGNQMPTDVTMPSYRGPYWADTEGRTPTADDFTFETRGRQNISDVWRANETASAAADAAKRAVPSATAYTAPGSGITNVVDPFAFEGNKARAPRVEYQGSSGGLGNTRAMQEKAAFMAAAPTPVIAGDRHPPITAPLQSRQVTQNDPMGLWRTFGTTSDYTGPTAAVQQDAGYQTPREARRRPTYNRVPKSTPSGSSGGRRSSGPWRLLA